MRLVRPPLAHAAMAAVALAVIAPAVGRAEAGRVVVLSVPGEGGGDYEDILVDALTDDHTVIDSREYEAAARRAGIEGYDPDQLGQVAHDLDADVVLDPVLAHDRRANVLTVRIRDRDGRLWRRMTVTIQARRLGRGGIRQLRERLLSEIDTLLAEEARRASDTRGRADDRDRARGRGDDGDGDDDRPLARGHDRDRVAARDDRDVRDARDARDARDPRDDDALDRENPLDGGRAGDPGDDGRAERSVRRRHAPAPDPRRAPFVIDAGPAAMNRNLTFTGQTFDQMPRGYHGAFVPAARVSGELYPIGFANRMSPAAGLGLYGEYTRVLKLTTRSTEAAEIALPTTQVQWEVGLRFRYAFGSRPTYPSLVLSVGYGRRQFIVDRTPLSGQTLDLPDVDYEVITPGLSLRVPLGTSHLALLAAGRFLAVRSAGEIQSPNEYGAATLTGLDAEAGFDVSITRQLVLKARGQLSRLGYDFTGNGAQTRNRDMDPSDQDIAGAADQWVSAWASLGFAF
ncbi:MAG TPA: hypothetical protein VHE35_07225 [Kofleriaceae bacterium]|nr:hypothetical protein [Kofleriaceae bacterium]